MPSPHRQGRRALKGAVLIAVIVASALTVFFLDRIIPLFHRTYTIVAVSPSAAGLRSGSPVWVAGVEVGKIRQVELLPLRDTVEHVALELQIRSSVEQQLRRDSRVRVTSRQLIGEKVVEVLPGSRTSPVLHDGDTLRIAPSPKAAEVLDRVRRLRRSLDTLRVDAGGLRGQFAHRQRELGRAMRQAALARRELTALRTGLRDGSLARIMALQAPGGPLSRAQRRTAEVQRLFGRAQARLGRARAALAPEQRRLMQDTRALQAELAALRALTNQPVGTLGRLQRDSALQQSLARTRAQLDSLMAEARKKPWRFVF